MVKMTWERGGARARWEEEEGGHMHMVRGATFCNVVRHFSMVHGGWCATER